ncbi:SNW/SKI-interacting protein A [Ziziphus jujuba]|uniref:SNW/SKI-interacting protein A n=1 Tax=Ziziphus jujuba TaxID=326968 RepID=A0ABM3IB87_ZIZJJ|nr:SNW/SKI-interacting protein A [Ziziphus jujuba]
MMDADMRGEYDHPKEKGMDFPKESTEEREGWLQWEKIQEERRRERERERRLEAKDAAMGKKSKITRDRDRDISEKVALGMACVGAGRGGEVMYDQRLFNKEKGMESGFAADDQYNVYDKGLFTAQPTLSTLYRPKKDIDTEMYGGADEKMEKILKIDRFKPDKGFTGTSEKNGPRDRPVEFEKDMEEADPFGLDMFLTQVKKGKKAIEKVGSGGTMAAVGGGSFRDDYEGGGSGRTRIGFERGR